MAELTERQQDQKAVEDMRAENLRRADREPVTFRGAPIARDERLDRGLEGST